MGEGLSSESVSRSRHYNQLRKVPSFSFSDGFISRHDDQESDFEGFPDDGTCSETSVAK